MITRKHRALLIASSLIASGIGASILFAPAQFHATHGIELSESASLLSEVRAPGGALLLLGVLMGLGAFLRRWTHTSTVLVTAVYLSYGVSRLWSLAVDGTPDPGLIGGTAIELLIGTLGAIALRRSPERRATPNVLPNLTGKAA